MKKSIILAAIFAAFIGKVAAQNNQDIIRLIPDPNALDSAVFEVQNKGGDYRVFRTNWHLQYFQKNEPLYIQIKFYSVNDTNKVLKKIPTYVKEFPSLWVTSSFLFFEKGTYAITIFNYMGPDKPQQKVEYSFVYWDTQDVDPNYITKNQYVVK